jgi:hypothetical protein
MIFLITMHSSDIDAFCHIQKSAPLNENKIVDAELKSLTQFFVNYPHYMKYESLTVHYLQMDIRKYCLFI